MKNLKRDTKLLVQKQKGGALQKSNRQIQAGYLAVGHYTAVMSKHFDWPRGIP